MKLSDYVAEFLANQGVKEAFVLTGGCIVHIIDSVASTENINYLPVQHEQSGAMAADAYARVSGGVGVAMATSGPGATNLLTGVCCSYYDSIPVVLITGQVPTSQLKRNSQSRQIGFQETDVVSIFGSITKYAVLIDNAEDIRYELEKAFFIAKEGRPGPVLLDICDDIQRADINPDELRQYIIPEIKPSKISSLLDSMISLINVSKRPLMVFGGGVRAAGAVQLAREVIDLLGIPFTLTWGAMDCMPGDHPKYVGGFGVTSGRAGNFAVQNADLLLCFGTRLDTHEAGPSYQTFAREAKKVVIDIDPAEQKKYREMGLEIDLLITADVRDIFEGMASRIEAFSVQDLSSWLEWIYRWKSNYPICLDEYRSQAERVNPYIFMNSLAKNIDENAILVTDCGSNLIWTMQGVKASGSSRFISAFNHSPMGYSLPASMGAAIADPNRQVICITGDAGLQINIQELATLQRHSLNVKIFVMNNHCHGIIQGTQDNWLDGRHHASHPKTGGLPDPDFEKIANAYGLASFSIDNHDALDQAIISVLNVRGPALCNIHMLQSAQIYPKLLFGRPIEDSSPLLPRDEFRGNMIVEPIT